jgi:hypothetical protein
MQAMKWLPTRGRDVVGRWCGFDKNGKALVGSLINRSSDNKPFCFLQSTPWLNEVTLDTSGAIVKGITG